MEKTINGTPFILNMSDVAPEDRGDTAASFLTKRIQSERHIVILERIKERTGAEYIDMDDAMVVLGTRLAFVSHKRNPIELCYLDGAPLVGFLAPLIKLGTPREGAGTVTVHNEMIDGDNMPGLNDKEAQMVFFAVASLYAAAKNT
jgi:hypothetical protein